MANDQIAGLTFGTLLRRHRLAAGLSQEELAERARMSTVGIGVLERGERRNPYRETVTLLANALGLSAEATAELESAAKKQRGLKSRGTLLPTETADRTPTNLPYVRGSLVGRTIEVPHIVRMLADERLVTITGTGGIGKTRTAIAVGHVFLERMASDVLLVDLAPLAAGSSVVVAVAQALNVQESPARPLADTLFVHLKQKRLLLIIDNCEHVIAEVADLVSTLLKGCPHVRVLATSREPLRIGGESAYRLPSLQVPSREQAATLTAVDAGAFSAIVLFAQRAQRVEHQFVIDDGNAPVVAEICRRLDGIPLAIELAAARVKVLSLRTLASRLDECLRILGHGDRTMPPRQQTMRALIAWSYDLLSGPEQRLFDRLSVFSGGCTLATAAAVFADPAFDEIGVLDLLSSLVDKSLVVADLDTPEPRYRLLESSRQYAHEQLAARGEATRAAALHALAYVELAERLEREHDVAPDATWFARFKCELENWRAALHWSLVMREDVLLGQRLASAMRVAWLAFPIVEGRRWLALALELVDAQTPANLAANLEYAVATSTYLFCEFEAALAGSRHLIAVYGELGDVLGLARAQFVAGRSLANLGRVAEGEALLQTALSAARALGNTPLVGLALAGLARARFAAGDASAARAHLAEAFAVYAASGVEGYPVFVESAAATIEFFAGDIERAVQFSSSALRTARRFGLTLIVTMELNYKAAYLIAGEDWDEARVSAREALRSAQETGQHVEVVWALLHLAACAVLTADDAGTPSGNLAHAARILGYIDARVAELGTSRQLVQEGEYARVRSILRDGIGSVQLEDAEQFGRSITQDQAIELARLL